jgi:Fe2+ or Zn2+ uptake regulation protein
MSAVAVKTDTRACAVCRRTKAKKAHLVCTSCWSAVPMADQHAITELHRRESGSNRHRMHCRKVVRALCEQKRAIKRQA